MTTSADPVDVTQTSRVRIACALSVFIASLALYVWTLAPTVTLVDSGELILAARSLGVAHPPGFPLYILLAHLATLVPIESVAARVNFASALFAALAVSVLMLLCIEATTTVRLLIAGPRARSREGRSARKKSRAQSGQSPHEAAPLRPVLLVVPCFVSALLLAFSRTLWAYATIAEVYSLNAALIIVIFVLMFRWRRMSIEYRTKRGPEGSVRGFSGDKPLYAAALFFGLALGVHHVTVGLMLPALAGLVFANEGLRFFKSRRLLYAALFAFGGLFAIYSYLPIAAARSPIMNWGDPRTFERLWWHVTGRQYQVFFSFSLQTMANQFSSFIKLAGREFGPWWFPAAPALAIAGLVKLFRRDRAMFWFLVLIIAANLVYSLGYEIAEDKDAYYLPAFIAAAIATGFGAQWFIDTVMSMRLTFSRAKPTVAMLILFVPLVTLAANLRYDNRRGYFIAQDYVGNIVSTIEPGGMLLTRDWQVYSPMLYAREIEHHRDDAVVIDINQLRRSWYFEYLNRAYPTTMAEARGKVDAFLEDLRHWEHDPDAYQRDVSLNQRINSRFFDMILAFVTNHLRSAPVYVTLDIAANHDGADSELTKSLAASYQFVPQGLVFQLASPGAFRQPSDLQLLTRGLTDGTLSFEDDDVVKLKVLPVYVTMLYNRGRYLAANGRHEQAIESFKQALGLQPGLNVAQQAIKESLDAMRKGSENNTQ